MDLTLIYLSAISATFASLLLVRTTPLLVRFYRTRIAGFVLRVVVYPFVFRRFPRIVPVNRIRAALLCLYLGLTIFCNAYDISDAGKAAARAGWLSIANLLPLIITGRMSVAMQVLGLSLQEALIAHFAAGLMLTAETIAHVALELRNSTVDLSERRMMAGLVMEAGAALTVAILILLFRRLMYELFLSLHTTLPILAIIGLWLHVNIRVNDPSAYSFLGLVVIIGTVTFQIILILFRRLVLKKQCGAAYVKLRGNAVLVEMNMVRRMTVQPGQFFYVWMPSAGFWSVFQSHPFMVSWQDKETLWLLIQPQRGFSRRLKALANEDVPNLVWLDGPYGNPPNFSQYDTVIFVADGMGVTSHLLAIKELLLRYRDRTAVTKSIQLFWQIESDNPQDWAKTWFDELLKLDEDYIFKISLFIQDTGAALDAQAWGTHECIQKFYGPTALLDRLLSTCSEGFTGRTLLSVSTMKYLRDEIRQMATAKTPSASEIRLHMCDFTVQSIWTPWAWLMPKVKG